MLWGPVTNIRFWWGFGEEIGGKHLRNMIQNALDGEVIQVPEGAGGSFLHFDDFLLGFSPVYPDGEARKLLKAAIKDCKENIRMQTADRMRRLRDFLSVG